MNRLLSIIISLSLCATMWAQSDEVHVTHFSEADGFGQDIVSFAIQDHYGYVWLGTWNGLCRYDGYRFQNYRMRPGDRSPLRTNRIAAIRELKDHNLECITNDGLTFLFHRTSGQFEKRKGNDSRPRAFKPSAQMETKVRSLPAFANAFINIVLVDRQGGIWVDTHSGLYRIWFGSKPLQPQKSVTSVEEAVRGLHVDKRGRTWVADKNGYIRVGGQYLSADGRLTGTPTQFGQKVYCIFEDSKGSVWLGAKPDGLTRLTPIGDGSRYTVKRYVHDAADKNSLSCNNVYDIAEDARGRLWIATYGGGLNVLDLNEDENEDEYFVTKTKTVTKDSQIRKRLRFIHRGNGLAGWTADVESQKVRCLHVTPQQVLVVGTLNGLYACNLKTDVGQMKFQHHHRKADDATSLGNDWVLDMEPLGGNTLAIATGGSGICIVDGRSLMNARPSFATYTTDNGLPSDVCQALLYKKATNELYIVSQASVCRMSLRDTTFTNYMRGILAGNFNLLDVKPVADTDGNILFGTTQGLLTVGSEQLSKSKYCPPIMFDCPDDIRLSSDERTLTIRFAALDFNRSVPITYAYRIEGMDDRWIYITDNHITLPDIPAGTFTLHLRSTNGDGVWVDNERTVTIHRRAAFHETPWAWMLYGLLIAMVAMVIYKVVRYIRHLQEEIKDIRLTSNQRMEVMSERIRELLSIRESVEKVEPVEVIENDEDRLFAERVKAFIDEHLSDSDLSVQDFAQAMAVSRTLLFARMKSVFGTSPNNYLLNRRIERAKEMLRQSGILVADAAYRCGFSDPKYFGKCFKKLVGKTPTEYQKG